MPSAQAPRLGACAVKIEELEITRIAKIENWCIAMRKLVIVG